MKDIFKLVKANITTRQAAERGQPQPTAACSGQVRNRRRSSVLLELMKDQKVCSQSRLRRPLPDSRNSRIVYRPSKTGYGRCERDRVSCRCAERSSRSIQLLDGS